MIDLSQIADITNWFELPVILAASWIALPINYVLVRCTKELVLWLILIGQVMLTSMFTLGYLTHGNLWIALGIPNFFFFGWLIYTTRRDLRELKSKE